MMTTTDKTAFEILYDTYSAMLYGVAVEISPTAKEADEILVITFSKAYRLKIAAQQYPVHCISLIKLLMQTAHQQYNNGTDKTNFTLKRFKNYPILHSLLCEQSTGKNDNQHDNATLKTSGEKLRAEMLLMRYVTSKQNLVPDNFGSPALLLK